MSRIKVDRITDKAGTGAPILVNGMNVTGKSTMGDIVGAAVTFNSITGGSANFSSDVSIGGTLTYEDVKNVDSVGLITARTGIKVTGGGIDVNAGGIDVTADGIKVIAGGIGIGTVTPSNLLEIQGANSAAAIRLTETNHSNLNRYGQIFEYGGSLYFQSRNDTANGDFIFRGGQDGVEKLRIGSSSQIGIAGANYGTAGQVLTSGGPSAAPQWASGGAGSGGWETIAYQKTSGDTYGSSQWISNGWDTAKYSQIKITAQQLITSYNNYHLYMQVYFTPGGGSESLATGSDYYRHSSAWRINGTNTTATLYDNTSYLAFGGGDSNETWNFDLTYQVNPNPTVNGLNVFRGTSSGYRSAQTWTYDERFIYGWHSGGMVTGVKIYTSSGNFGKSGQWHITGRLL